GVLGKAGFRISAEQRKRVALADLVPEVFEPDGGAVIALGPHQRDHFAEGADLSAIAPRPVEEIGHYGSKAILVGPTVDHELRQRFLGIEANELIACSRTGDIEPHRG